MMIKGSMITKGSVAVTDLGSERLCSECLCWIWCLWRKKEDIAHRPGFRLGQGVLDRVRGVWSRYWPQPKDNLQNAENPEARNLLFLALLYRVRH